MEATVPASIRDLVTSRDWTDSLGQLGEEAVETQLAMYAESQRDLAERVKSLDSLFEHTASKIVGSITGPEDLAALAALPAEIARKTLWQSASLPYPVFRMLRRALDVETAGDGSDDPYGAGDFSLRDVDEWILVNERALRDSQQGDWKRGLVDWETHSNLVFDSPLSAATMNAPKVIMRPELPGYAFLDELRPPSVSVQPTMRAFRTAFDKITDSLLSGLNWCNVFVAGGIILSTLSAVTTGDIKNYINSDIDVYIHGLGPVEANAKVQHLFNVWRSNLPENARDEVTVVRNSRTITFFSRYPLKRLQIVLKLVKHPKEVLLNFDLDICAMGYNGETVLMLPRACRALESASNPLLRSAAVFHLRL